MAQLTNDDAITGGELSKLVITGTDVSDSIDISGDEGNYFNYTINAGEGDDTVKLRTHFYFSGEEVVDGGLGNDKVIFSFSNFGFDSFSIIDGVVSFEQEGYGLHKIRNVELFQFGDILLNFNELASSVQLSPYTSQNLIGSSNDDVLMGGTYDDIFDGGGGNDLIYTGGGNDIVDGGDGEDTLVIDLDSRQITSISYEEGVLSYRPIGINSTIPSETVSITNVEKIRFTDQTIDLANIQLTFPEIYGLTIQGTNNADTLVGNQGNNLIIPGAGDDIVDGGSANGGVGIDQDTIVFNISTAEVTSFTTEATLYSDGVTTIVSSEGIDLINNIEQFIFADGIYSLEQVIGGNGIPSIFSSVNTKDQIISGDSNPNFFHDDTYAAQANVINGGFGNDKLYGGFGEDTITPGLGDDYIDGGEGGIRNIYTTLLQGDGDDKVIFNILSTDVSSFAIHDALVEVIDPNGYRSTTTGQDGLHGTFEFTSSEGTDNIINVELFEFKDITLSIEQIAEYFRDITYIPNQKIYLHSYYEYVVKGGKGDDEIVNLASNITNAGPFSLDGGDGFDTLITGYDSKYASFVETDEGKVDLNIHNTKFSFKNIERVEFNDVTYFFFDQNLVGTNFSDNLFGDYGDDTISPLNGVDTIDGRTGIDTVIIDVASTAVTQFTNHYADGSIRIDSDQGPDTLLNIEFVQFTDKTISVTDLPVELANVHSQRIVGTIDADELIGGAGNDGFTPLEGDDNVDGKQGNDWVDLNVNTWDVLDYSQADGIIKLQTSEGEDTFTNVELFKFIDKNISLEDLDATFRSEDSESESNEVEEPQERSTRVLYDAELDISGSDTITIPKGDGIVYGKKDGLDWFANVFSISDSYDLTVYVYDGGSIVYTYGGNDILYGGEGGNFPFDNDQFDAGDGNDELYGYAGDDELDGGRGNDKLFGGLGNDELDGGSGDDFLYGEEGDDQLIGGLGSRSVFGVIEGTYELNGHDVYDGGPGEDTFSFNTNLALNYVTSITLKADGSYVFVYGGGSGSDTLINIEKIGNFSAEEFFAKYEDYVVDERPEDQKTKNNSTDPDDTASLSFSLADIVGATRKVNGDVVLKTNNGEVTLSPNENRAFLDNTTVNLDSIVNTHNAGKPRFNVVGSDGSTIQATPDKYTGAVTYLEYQLLGDEIGNVVTGSAFNDFLNLLGGDDAANGGDGQDVLDGGTGSNFLTGGNGADTFFLDGRGGTTTWSTVTDFSGDNVNIWGWVEGVSKLLLTQENAGADGFLGATFHYDLNNDGTIDTSITFSGLSTSQVPDSSAQVVAGNGYLLFA